nr:MAG TPA: hypothetical protein [Caudoviricetes sp.]
MDSEGYAFYNSRNKSQNSLSLHLYHMAYCRYDTLQNFGKVSLTIKLLSCHNLFHKNHILHESFILPLLNLNQFPFKTLSAE